MVLGAMFGSGIVQAESENDAMVESPSAWAASWSNTNTSKQGVHCIYCAAFARRGSDRDTDRGILKFSGLPSDDGSMTASLAGRHAYDECNGLQHDSVPHRQTRQSHRDRMPSLRHLVVSVGCVSCVEITGPGDMQPSVFACFLNFY